MLVTSCKVMPGTIKRRQDLFWLVFSKGTVHSWLTVASGLWKPSTTAEEYGGATSHSDQVVGRSRRKEQDVSWVCPQDLFPPPRPHQIKPQKQGNVTDSEQLLTWLSPYTGASHTYCSSGFGVTEAWNSQEWSSRGSKTKTVSGKRQFPAAQ